MSDATRVDLLVRGPLCQRQMVLLYIPGVILVLSTPWALERARVDGAEAVCSDCKVDTVAGVQSKWSSIRGRTKRYLSAPFVVWIGPQEHAGTVYMGGEALAVNVACSEQTCDHAFIVDYGKDGSIRQRRRCRRWYRPMVTIDKHMPSFDGFRRAGYDDASLCRFHLYKCIEEWLKGHSIQGDAAVALVWAFRLIARSASTVQAFALRNHFVRFVVAQGARVTPLWTLEQAEEVVGYLDRCWMYPDWMLRAWIDAVLLERLVAGLAFLTTTGFCEGGHSYYSKFMMRSLANKVVSQTVVKTMGTNADGSSTSGFFPDAERRWTEAEGCTPPISPDRSVRQARAQLAFLEFGTSMVQVHNDCILVPSFNSTVVRRHAESSATRRTDRGVEPPFPPFLEPMRRALAYGGPRSFSVPDMHSLDRSTHPRRCSCLDSTYHGILCAHGGCKHDHFADMVLEARVSPDAEEAVRVRELARLKAFLHSRERSKPDEARCKPIYIATCPTATTTGPELVALSWHCCENTRQSRRRARARRCYASAPRPRRRRAITMLRRPSALRSRRQYARARQTQMQSVRGPS